MVQNGRTVRKSYMQYCPIAHALDVVGERWSLLIVRELMRGPLRYTDLGERLPGIGTNILASRLRDLEAGGVLARRKLPPPTPVTVYELTEHGRGLERVLSELAYWGVRSLGPPPEDEVFEDGWLEGALRTMVCRAPVAGTFEFRAGDVVANVTDGTVAPGPAERPDAVLTTTPRGFYDLFVLRSWDGVEVEGDEAAAERFVAEVGLPEGAVLAEAAAAPA